jgi:hypothetical protein
LGREDAGKSPLMVWSMKHSGGFQSHRCLIQL